MRTVWKIVIVLALVLPSGAFVAGSLAASSADQPTPRHTIVIREDAGSPSPSASPRRAGSSADASDDHPDRSVEVVTPTPGDLRDDHGGTSGGGHGSDDSGSGSGSGHSGGTDDSGGHGGGHG